MKYFLLRQIMFRLSESILPTTKLVFGGFNLKREFGKEIYRF